MTTWLPGASVYDLHPGIGNGPFDNLLGVCLHVNVDEHGTPHTFWGNGNPGQVCPNFQVFKDGSIDQMLPFDWQPWCQVSGNFNYAAIETAGLPSEPLTAQQVTSIAKIMRVYHDMGVPYNATDTPGTKGLIVHSAGGAAWGGHSCPGTIRASQRARILQVARGGVPPVPVNDDEGGSMFVFSVDETTVPKGTPWPGIGTFNGKSARHLVDAESAVNIRNGLGQKAYVPVSYAQWKAWGGWV
jgi:hypothetical protein